jgi:putative endonuclease
MFFTYILKSLKDGKYYYGSTINIVDRLAYHNKRKVKSTKSRAPLIVHYSEKFATRVEAVRRERFFKSIVGYLWLKNENII